MTLTISVKINGNHEAFGRMKSTKFFPDSLIENTVIFNGRLPAHTANQANSFHVIFPLAVR
jgi:hypothetical protein